LLCTSVREGELMSPLTFLRFLSVEQSRSRAAAPPSLSPISFSSHLIHANGRTGP
uniref:Uncharacterized protein n=1 Tax=Aegilops tauschii subsp. strangulata TaxID=200361 RepID=A0A452ZHD2_AEGTS